MDKAPDAFRTISEVADDLDVPQHVLRFWETRFKEIKPLKRAGGRRYYRPEDIELLRGIRQLLYGQGYTIRGVQRILREQGPRHVQNMARGVAQAAPETRPVAAAPAPRPAASAPPARPSLSGDALRKLQSALDELQECRRLISQGGADRA